MDNGIYDYTNAGFDKFFNRSVDASPQQNLDTPPAVASNAQRFDDYQVSGKVGDTFRVGNVYLDGAAGKISIYDDSGNEIARFGNLGDV